MRSTLLMAVLFLIASCTSGDKKSGDPTANQHSLAPLLHQYYEDHLKLSPLEATQNGDNRYNDQLPNDMTAAFRNREKQMLQQYLDSLQAYDRSTLSENDQMSYDVLKWELTISMERLQYPDDLMPINQFWSLPLTMGQLGSGSGNQPFKTVKDYENWLGRIDGFSHWCDSAIGNMRMGMARGVVYPKILIERVLPQLQSIIVADVTTSLFYQPVIKMKELNFTDEDNKRIAALYSKAITEQINPSYQKLHDFLRMNTCRNAGPLPAFQPFQVETRIINS